MDVSGNLTVNALASLASAIGEPARASILTALMGGEALTAGELSKRAGVTPSTTSSHLARLRVNQLIVEARQGRHRYYALASNEIASLLETMMTTAATADRVRPGPRDEALRRARTCYDHLAGRAGVRIAAAMATLGVVELDPSAARLNPGAAEILEWRLGLSVDFGSGRRRACLACMDWSERQPHLAGQLGATLLTTALDRGWISRVAGSRAVDVTLRGRTELFRAIGIDWDTS